jgi:hypothetical protein
MLVSRSGSCRAANDPPGQGIVLSTGRLDCRWQRQLIVHILDVLFLLRRSHSAASPVARERVRSMHFSCRSQTQYRPPAWSIGNVTSGQNGSPNERPRPLSVGSWCPRSGATCSEGTSRVRRDRYVLTRGAGRSSSTTSPACWKHRPVIADGELPSIRGQDPVDVGTLIASAPDALPPTARRAPGQRDVLAEPPALRHRPRVAAPPRRLRARPVLGTPPSLRTASFRTGDRGRITAGRLSAGEEFSGTVEETVDCYTRAIRARQPHGPYAIAGYSDGGVARVRARRFSKRKANASTSSAIPRISMSACAPVLRFPLPWCGPGQPSEHGELRAATRSRAGSRNRDRFRGAVPDAAAVGLRGCLHRDLDIGAHLRDDHPESTRVVLRNQAIHARFLDAGHSLSYRWGDDPVTCRFVLGLSAGYPVRAENFIRAGESFGSWCPRTLSFVALMYAGMATPRRS